MKNLQSLIPTTVVFSSLVLIAGCQSNPSTAQSPDNSAAQTASQRTPDGDQLNGPIPYPHYPYDIARGGGGGSTR